MSNLSSKKKELSSEQSEELLGALKARFEKNMNRHKGLEWVKVQTKLEANPGKLWSLDEMERTGVLENSAAPSLLIAATTLSSCITTVRPLTLAVGRSRAR